MNKSEVVKNVANLAGLTTQQAHHAVDAVCATIIDALSNGQEVSILGFGTFRVATQSERIGRHPQTGEALTIPAKKVAKFKAGKALKDCIA